jgi:hypothetical protein
VYWKRSIFDRKRQIVEIKPLSLIALPDFNHCRVSAVEADGKLLLRRG